MCVYAGSVYASAHTETRGQLAEFSSLLPCDFRTALKLSGMQQAPFPNSCLCQPLKVTFRKDNTISEEDEMIREESLRYVSEMCLDKRKALQCR